MSILGFCRRVEGGESLGPRTVDTGVVRLHVDARHFAAVHLESIAFGAFVA